MSKEIGQLNSKELFQNIMCSDFHSIYGISWS